MSRDYSESDIRRMLEAAVFLVREDAWLGSPFGAANEVTREEIAQKILGNHLPHYRQAMPPELADVVDTSRIEERCRSAIRQFRGPNYVFK